MIPCFRVLYVEINELETNGVIEIDRALTPIPSSLLQLQLTSLSSCIGMVETFPAYSRGKSL